MNKIRIISAIILLCGLFLSILFLVLTKESRNKVHNIYYKYYFSSDSYLYSFESDGFYNTIEEKLFDTQVKVSVSIFVFYVLSCLTYLTFFIFKRLKENNIKSVCGNSVDFECAPWDDFNVKLFFFCDVLYIIECILVPIYYGQAKLVYDTYDYEKLDEYSSLESIKNNYKASIIVCYIFLAIFLPIYLYILNNYYTFFKKAYIYDINDFFAKLFSIFRCKCTQSVEEKKQELGDLKFDILKLTQKNFELKLEQNEKEVKRLNEEKKKKVNELEEFKKTLTPEDINPQNSDLKQRLDKIIDIGREIQRKDQYRDKLRTLNEALKGQIQTIELKIQENLGANALQQGAWKLEILSKEENSKIFKEAMDLDKHVREQLDRNNELLTIANNNALGLSYNLEEQRLVAQYLAPTCRSSEKMI